MTGSPIQPEEIVLVCALVVLGCVVCFGVYFAIENCRQSFPPFICSRATVTAAQTYSPASVFARTVSVPVLRVEEGNSISV